MIWKKEISLELLNAFLKNTMCETLGMEMVEFGENYLKATMPVNKNTVQPMRILHGGASVALAESLGSIAAYFCLEKANTYAVGLDINANHIRSVDEGNFVTGICKPYHLGKSTQVWHIEIMDKQNKLVAVSRLTMSILEKH